MCETEENTPPIACDLSALSDHERTRRAELARVIGEHVTSLDETRSGYRIRLSENATIHREALQLILLERRCCPFLHLSLEFEPGHGEAVLSIGGGEGVKDFLDATDVLGCARMPRAAAERSGPSGSPSTD